jgi:hypothetical protein
MATKGVSAGTVAWNEPAPEVTEGLDPLTKLGGKLFKHWAPCTLASASLRYLAFKSLRQHRSFVFLQLFDHGTLPLGQNKIGVDAPDSYLPSITMLVPFTRAVTDVRPMGGATPSSTNNRKNIRQEPYAIIYH